ncbi:hypothetical protein M0638_12595 [Roseomonas sp. NAR14]|uniref:Uncharacterized protein n=1 Tax=Roseomonas acroporae TaxID=2937791 RepID=A0A9X1Y6Q8_9PROT|nr:hypothetical protein [Roseomonas acroporae]MCK8785224.1 hypothetical protein [Roseomonas acroporae]
MDRDDDCCREQERLARELAERRSDAEKRAMLQRCLSAYWALRAAGWPWKPRVRVKAGRG